MARARTKPQRASSSDDSEKEKVNHPDHYGGEDNPYEVINIIEYFKLNFHVGNTVKYILRAGKKGGESYLIALKKAYWYLGREIERLEKDG